MRPVRPERYSAPIVSIRFASHHIHVDGHETLELPLQINRRLGDRFVFLFKFFLRFFACRSPARFSPRHRAVPLVTPDQ